jgi:hypothetical protein
MNIIFKSKSKSKNPNFVSRVNSLSGSDPWFLIFSISGGRTEKLLDLVFMPKSKSSSGSRLSARWK